MYNGLYTEELSWLINMGQGERVGGRPSHHHLRTQGHHTWLPKAPGPPAIQWEWGAWTDLSGRALEYRPWDAGPLS